MPRTQQNLFAVSLLALVAPLSACAVDDTTDDAGYVDLGAEQGHGEGDDVHPGADLRRQRKQVLTFDDDRRPFNSRNPMFYYGGERSDLTGLELTDWAVDWVSRRRPDQFWLEFDADGYVLIDVVAGTSQLDLAVDVYDIDGNLLTTADWEGEAGLESVFLEATAGSDPVCIVVRNVGKRSGRYVITVDAAY